VSKNFDVCGKKRLRGLFVDFRQRFTGGAEVLRDADWTTGRCSGGHEVYIAGSMGGARQGDLAHLVLFVSTLFDIANI
jgi:hypothetical protein